MGFKKRNAERALRMFLKETLRNAQSLRDFSARDLLRAGEALDQGAANFLERLLRLLLLLFVLFFTFTRVEEEDGDGTADES